MSLTLQVGFFNSYYVKRLADVPNIPSIGDPSWNAPQVSVPAQDWYIEESRIRGGYNNVSTDYGVKAYIVEEQANQTRRGSSLIYSGIFNSRTGINQTNQFSVAEEITRSVDPISGSIQKLFAEDTNLLVFQERKVNNALIDKDAIYTAEGSAITTSGRIVIGQITPISGEWGIATNPESFADYGYAKYFVDRHRGAVLRLAGGQITEISNYGMIDWFRDNLSTVDSSSFGPGKILGGWDMYTKQYTVSLQKNPKNPAQPDYSTLQFDEAVLGWPSFYSFKPSWMFSLGSRFYSVAKGTATHDIVFVHNDDTVNRARFYGVDYKSNITFVVNPDVGRSKVFKTVNYEGSNGWEIISLVSDITGSDSISVDSSNLPYGFYNLKLEIQQMVYIVIMKENI